MQIRRRVRSYSACQGTKFLLTACYERKFKHKHESSWAQRENVRRGERGEKELHSSFKEIKRKKTVYV